MREIFHGIQDRLAAVCESHRFVPAPELTSNSFKSWPPGVTTDCIVANARLVSYPGYTASLRRSEGKSEPAAA